MSARLLRLWTFIVAAWSLRTWGLRLSRRRDASAEANGRRFDAAQRAAARQRLIERALAFVSRLVEPARRLIAERRVKYRPECRWYPGTVAVSFDDRAAFGPRGVERGEGLSAETRAYIASQRRRALAAAGYVGIEEVTAAAPTNTEAP